MTTYRLQREQRPVAERPLLDVDQQAVVDHAGGPLLVLAGPGTGKTTTLVEAIARRVEDGADPASVLALTFSRKAAEQLRDRVTARLGRTMGAAPCSTFHSFAYALIRRYAPAELYATPLRLLSAPEQDVVLQDLLTHAPESVRWPDTLRQAVGTRGFAREVLDVLARAREKGLSPEDLCRIGRDEQIPEFEAAGLFLDQYLLNLDAQGATDYADLIQRAVLDAEEHRAELRSRFGHVFVDEYQDTDPSQVRLLQALAGGGRNLVVVGDPHQSIYAFRGAEVRGILEFPSEFRRGDGCPADVVALRTTRRFGPRLLLASQRVAGRLTLPGSIPTAVQEAFARPRAVGTDQPGDGVEVITYDTARAEAEHLADRLRKAHLEDGIAWSEMAVLVRSGRSVLPAARRSLAAAGVPVEVAADETPLGQEPAVQPLLTALRLVVHRDAEGAVVGADSPHHVDAAAVSGLLVSSLVGLDATELRALARQARTRERALAAAAERTPRPSADLVWAAVLDPDLLTGLSGDAVDRAADFARLLQRARTVLEADGTAEEVLWTLWDGTSWPRRLRSRVESGGQAARLAHRDLDAVSALFEAAARADQQRGLRAVGEFLATLRAQQIPADTLADRGVRGEAVRLLTAHRAKGLEWELVVVAHAQEEVWPDLRRRGSLLAPDRLGPDGVVPPVTTRALLTEERRLFYVACTRARRRLLVTAVASPEDDGEQPSRFLHELFPTGESRVRHESGRPRRPLSLAGVVAELRRTVSDPGQPEPLRKAAARRLARLAAERVGGRGLVPAADPATWWGTRALTVSERPLVPADRPVPVTASMLSSITECPAKWFLEREAGGARATSASQGFGNVVHAIADGVTRAGLDGDETAGAGPDAIDTLMSLVDGVWRQLTFRTPWSADRERAEVQAALGRFLNWHHRDRGRTAVASEADFRAAVTLPDGEQVTLRGRADRLEVDAEGRVVVIDLKTGKYPPTEKELAGHAQLGLYQYAVDHDGFAEVVGPDARSGGAELWQLRKGTELKVQSQGPQQPGESGHLPVEEQLMAAVRVVRTEALEARPGKVCEHCDFQLLCPAQQPGTVLS